MTYFYNVKVRGGVSQTPPRKWPLRPPEVVFEAGNQMHGIYKDILGPEMDRKWAGNGIIDINDIDIIEAMDTIEIVEGIEIIIMIIIIIIIISIGIFLTVTT